MGASGTDVLLSARAKELFPYAVEAKFQEATGPMYKFWEQACTNGGKDVPLLFVKKAHAPPLVVMDAEYFFELIGHK